MKYLIGLLFIFFSFSALAQPGAGDPNGGGKPGGNAVPISGIEIIIAAGAAFGANHLRKKVKSND